MKNDLLVTKDVMETICPACKNKAKVSVMLIRKTKPHKRLTFTECVGCGMNETAEEDLDKLSYGVRVTCDFTKDVEKHLRRMVFVNNLAITEFYKDDVMIFSFYTMNSNIDCVEGVILRAEDIVEANMLGDLDLAQPLADLRSIKTTGFKMVIADVSGYSRVCPIGMEYTEAQDMSLRQLNAKCPEVIHEKISKRHAAATREANETMTTCDDADADAN